MSHKRSRPKLLMIMAAVVISSAIGTRAAAAAADCEAMPAGPAKTDCYLVRARIARDKADIAASTARINADAARLRAITGVEPRVGTRKPKRKPRG